MNNLKDYYKRTSIKYDSLRFDMEDEVASHCKWFMTNLNPQSKINLEIGCGTGRYASEFTSEGLFTVGLDKSESQLSVAQNKIPVLNCDIDNYPYQKETFNVVSMIMMLHQLEKTSLLKLFPNLFMSLKKKGLLWIKTCSMTDLAHRPLNKYFPSALELNMNRYPRISQLESLILKAGFKESRNYVVKNNYELKGSDIITRVKEKHNSTLHLIPETEFHKGLSEIESFYNTNENYRFEHSHTLLEFQK